MKKRNPARLAAMALLGAAILIPVGAAARGKSDDAYVFFLDKSSVTMSGSLDDLAAARAARENNRGNVLWFRRAGTEYVVSDPGVIRAFVELHPTEEATDSRLDKLEAEIEDLDDLLEDLSDRKDDLEDRAGDTAQLKRAMADTEREITAVSAKIDRLSAEQDELGRELERQEAEADRRIGELLHRAVTTGAARPVESSKP